MSDSESLKQQGFDWARSSTFQSYNHYLGYYQVHSCLEYAKKGSLLDMPCGDGTLTEMFLPYFDQVTGIDASSKHLAEAQKRLPDVRFHQALIEDVELEDRFDTIVMLNVLEHVQDPIFVLRKAADLLKDDGVLIVHVPNALAINRKISVIMGSLESCEELSPFDIHVAGHRRSYTMDTLKQDVLEAGLKVTNTGGVFYKMLSTPQMDWILSKGPWEEGGFGWGRVGAENSKDWKSAFCHACYEIGKERPDDCNVIYVVIKK